MIKVLTESELLQRTLKENDIMKRMLDILITHIRPDGDIAQFDTKSQQTLADLSKQFEEVHNG